MDLSTQVAKNTREFITNNNKRGASIARVCGEEHSGEASNGTAILYLTGDNDLCYISDLKFKLVFNNGDENAWMNMPIPAHWAVGHNLWRTITDFKAAYGIGVALDVDGKYGAQCVDYANAFWYGMTGRGINCGGDNARGIWNNSKYINAGSEFDLITNKNQLKAGDWVVWGTGTYGHIAMAVASPSGNTIKVWNQNNTGIPWPAGGKAISEDTMSLDGFIGAFRPKYWN